MTDPQGRTVRTDVSTPVPRTAAEFAEYYKSSTIGRDNAHDIEYYRSKFVVNPERAEAYRTSAHAERARHVQEKSPYIISIPMQTRAVMLRRVQILKGNIGAQVIQIA